MSSLVWWVGQGCVGRKPSGRPRGRTHPGEEGEGAERGVDEDDWRAADSGDGHGALKLGQLGEVAVDGLD